MKVYQIAKFAKHLEKTLLNAFHECKDKMTLKCETWPLQISTVTSKTVVWFGVDLLGFCETKSYFANRVNWAYKTPVSEIFTDLGHNKIFVEQNETFNEA